MILLQISRYGNKVGYVLSKNPQFYESPIFWVIVVIAIIGIIVYLKK